MFTILGSVLGLAGSFLPKIFTFFQDKSDKKHELATLDKQLALADRESSNRLNEIAANSVADMELAYADIARESNKQAHTPMVATGIRFIDGLRGSVRPIVTYLFVLMYIGSKVFLMWHAVSTDASMTEFANVIFDPEDMALLSTIMGFWFGERLQRACK